MPQIRPLPSFQPDDDVEVTNQQFYDTATTLPLWNSGNFMARETMTEPLSTSPLPNSRPLTTQMPGVSGSLYDKAMSQSLISALQSTIQIKPKSRIVVIPSERKRTTTALLPETSAKRLSPKVRLAITLGSFLTVLLITLLSLTSISTGQDSQPLASNVIQWVQSQQLRVTIFGHTLPIVQNAPAAPVATTAPPVATLPQSQYIAIAQQDASAVGISPIYFVRQINQESGFNPYAVSPAGAEGIAQFEPGTAAGLGIDPFNPVQALNAAAHLMASYANQYGGNYAMALAAYNAGSGTVQYAINACGAANWMNCLPAETQNYIYVIMGI